MAAQLNKSKYVFINMLFIILGIIGYYIIQSSFEKLQQFEQMQQMPQIQIAGLTSGPSFVGGNIISEQSLLKTPYSKESVVYYRAIKERKTVDSKGNTTWRIVDTNQDYINFEISDGSGKVIIIYDNGVDWNIPETYANTTNTERYREWTLKPNDYIYIHGEPISQNESNLISFIAKNISTQALNEQLGDKSITIVAFIAIGFPLLSFGVISAIRLLNIHQTIFYLIALMILSVSLLMHLSLTLTKNNLISAEKNYNIQMQASNKALQEIFQTNGISYPGLEFLSQDQLNKPGLFKANDRNKIEAILLNLSLKESVYKQLLQKFPNNIMARLLNINAPKLNWPNYKNHQQEPDNNLEIQNKLKVDPIILWSVLIISFVLMVITGYLGYRTIRFKRMIENLAFRPISSLVPGLSKIKGNVTISNNQEQLIAPLSKKNCVYYRYIVTEQRNDGKKSKTHTIKDIKKHTDFYLSEDSAKILIESKGANFVSKHKMTKKHGERQYQETRIEVGDESLIIGTIEFNTKENQDLLIMREQSTSEPFICSNDSENNLIQGQLLKGLLGINLSFSCLMVCLLFISLAGGYLSAISFLVAAIAPLGLMTFFITILHYNDMVFLRQRVDKNYYNIHALLKKKMNILPALENIITQNMNHETSLLKQITSMRTLDLENSKPSTIKKALNTSESISQKTLKTIEQYPDLKSNSLVKHLMDTIVIQENELSLLKNAYTDSLEKYHSRIKTFPDKLIAKWAGFKIKPYLFEKKQ